jgi:hypothetical protein
MRVFAEVTVPKVRSGCSPVIAARVDRGAHRDGGGGPIVLPYEGKIVLVERGECTFEEKARHAQDAGAIGVIVINSDVFLSFYFRA